MNEVEYIESMSALKVKAGDTVVVRVGKYLSDNKAQMVKEEVYSKLPVKIRDSIGILVMGPDYDIGVLREGKKCK